MIELDSKLPNKTFPINLVVYSDSHGRLLSTNHFNSFEPRAGLDRLASYLKRLKTAGETILTIDNGDAIQGTPLVDLHDYTKMRQVKLRHPVSIFHEYIDLDCFIPGNHEFNFGIDHLMHIRQESKAEWISANIVRTGKTDNGGLLFQPYKIFDYDGIKIGIIGLVTDFVVKWENASAVRGLEFRNVVETCDYYIPVVRKACDILIVAYHGGMKADPATGESWSVGKTTENQGLDIWDRFPEIDLLITGHQHRSYIYCPKLEKRAIVVQPSSYSRQWAHFIIEKQKISEPPQTLKVSYSIKTDPGLVTAFTEEPDPEISKRLLLHQENTESILNTPVGFLDTSFEIADPMKDVWLKKHPLIQWITELMSSQAGVEVAGIPLLSSNLKGMSGNITIRDILSFFFFQDTVCVIEINGSILKAALEKSAGFFSLENLEHGITKIGINPDWQKSRVLSYNYDIWNGIEYCFDLRKPLGRRLISATVNGHLISDDEVLQVAVTSYRSAGAFYDMFSPDQIIRNYTTRITDLMINDLVKNKHLSIKTVQNFNIIF